MTTISIIVAISANGVIGKDGHIPWHLPADLAYFKRITTGHPVVMGRVTHESIGGLLAGRTNIVLTSNPIFEIEEGGMTAKSVDEAKSMVDKLKINGGDEIFFAGGAEVYREVLPTADRLYVTAIEQSFEGDTLFPIVEWEEWELVSERDGEVNDENPYKYTHKVYERKRKS